MLKMRNQVDKEKEDLVKYLWEGMKAPYRDLLVHRARCPSAHPDECDVDETGVNLVDPTNNVRQASWPAAWALGL